MNGYSSRGIVFCIEKALLCVTAVCMANEGAPAAKPVLRSAKHTIVSSNESPEANAETAAQEKAGDFCLSAGYTMVLGWMDMYPDEYHFIPTHGGFLGGGWLMGRNRICVELMIATGESDATDMAPVNTSSSLDDTFEDLNVFMYGVGGTWYFEHLRFGNAVIVAPGVTFGFCHTFYHFRGSQSSKSFDAFKFGTVFVRLKLGQGRYRGVFDAGCSITGTQPERPIMTLYGLTPILLFRPGLEITF